MATGLSCTSHRSGFLEIAPEAGIQVQGIYQGCAQRGRKWSARVGKSLNFHITPESLKKINHMQKKI